MCYTPIAPLGLFMLCLPNKADIGIGRGKMPRLRGVVVLRSGVRCLTYRGGILLGFTLSMQQKGCC